MWKWSFRQKVWIYRIQYKDQHSNQDNKRWGNRKLAQTIRVGKNRKVSMISRYRENQSSLKLYKTKWTVLLLLCMLMIVALTGCGIFSDITEQPYVKEEEDLVVVGFSQLGSESFWRTANTQSVQENLSKENGFYLMMQNARQKQENQIKTIRNFISQRVDYIVFSPIEESGWDTVLEEAKQAGIPVILMDRNVDVADQTLYKTHVGSDFTEEGTKAGRWLEQELNNRGRLDEEINIVVLEGTKGASSQIGRTVGFKSIAGKYKNWHILAERTADFTATKGKEVMEGLLQKYSDIDVVVSQNDDMTFGAIEAIEEAGRTVGVDGDMMIISFDAVSDALKLVQQGIINVDIECNPNQGEVIAEILKKLESGEEIERQYFVEEDVFTIDNVTEELLNGRNY